MSEIDLDYNHDQAAYMLECRRFLERVEVYKLPKISVVICRIVQCFSGTTSSPAGKIPAFIQRLVDDGMHDQALIETVARHASFFVDRNTWYNFTFLDKTDGSRSSSIVSGASSFGLALASAYVYWRYLRFEAAQNKLGEELKSPAGQLHECAEP